MPYVFPEQIADLVQRARYTKGGKDASIARLCKPEIGLEYRKPVHRLDTAAATVGVTGDELEALMQAVLSDLQHNELLAGKIKEVLVLAKLTYSDALAPVRERLRMDRERWEQRERDSMTRNVAYQDKIKKIMKDYDAAAGTVETKFRKMIRSLIALARKEPELDIMDPHDRALVQFLFNRGLALYNTHNTMLVEIAPSLLEKDRTWIEDFVEEMAIYMADAGFPITKTN